MNTAERSRVRFPSFVLKTKTTEENRIENKWPVFFPPKEGKKWNKATKVLIEAKIGLFGELHGPDIYINLKKAESYKDLAKVIQESNVKFCIYAVIRGLTKGMCTDLIKMGVEYHDIKGVEVHEMYSGNKQRLTFISTDMIWANVI